MIDDSPILPSRLAAVLLVLPLAFVAGCDKPAIPKPLLRGLDQTFVTGGRADDGDPLTGPGMRYRHPERSAKDGSTYAESNPLSYRTLTGKAVAKSGPKAFRAAAAKVANKATSKFEVRYTSACQFEISGGVSVVLNEGNAGYRIMARILDSSGKPVPGADFRIRYEFVENSDGQLDIFLDGEKHGQVAKGAFYSPGDKGPAAPFTLPPGEYTLQFGLNIEAEAERSAEIEVNVTVNLI